MIVKVQLALFASGSKAEAAPALVYDRTRRYLAQIEQTSELVKKMGGATKAFFHAKLEGSTLVLLEPAPWQEW